MEKYYAAFAAFGGLTAIGGLIDFLMRKNEQKRLREWLIDWWIRFDDVKWSNFGRREAAQAIELIDRTAGARFWSGQRFRFVASVVIVCVAASFVLLTVAEIRGWARQPERERPLLDQLGGYWAGKGGDPQAWPAVIVALALCAVAFATSLSVMRWLASLVQRLALGGTAGIVFFSGLVVVQCLLLVYWNTVVFTSAVMVPVAIVFLWGERDPLQIIGEGFRLYDDLAPLAVMERTLQVFAVDRGLISTGPADTFFMVKALLDIIANALRIGFALVFLSSFVFRPIVQPLVSRVWERIIESNRPLFTMLFGALGTLCAVIAAIAR